MNYLSLPAEKYWAFPKAYKGDKKSEIRQLIFSGEYLGSLKKNGHYFRFVKDEEGKMFLRSRDLDTKGQIIDKFLKVPHLHSFFESLPKGTCFMGEIYFPKRPGSRHVTTVMNCLDSKAVERQKEEKLHFYIYDLWQYNGEDFLKATIEQRIGKLNEIRKNYTDSPLFKSNEYVEFALYYHGKNLWNLLSWALENGEEGIVMTRMGSKPEPGKRTTRKTLKIKQELEEPIDVFFTGRYKAATKLYTGKEIETWNFWENIRTGQKQFGEYYRDFFEGKPLEPVTKNYFYGWAGSIEIGAYDEREKKIVSIGWLSGLTDEIKREIVENNSAYKLRPCIVTAMLIEGDSGKLQHGKFLGFRDDISWESCTTDKIYG